jgi:hypothetical protein
LNFKGGGFSVVLPVWPPTTRIRSVPASEVISPRDFFWLSMPRETTLRLVQ